MTEQTILTQQDIDKNEAKLQGLITLVSTGHSLLFTGAGCSVNLGYPTWPGLIEELETLIDLPEKRDQALKRNHPTIYVDVIKKFVHEKDGNCEKYWGKLKEIFKPDDWEF